ncbi:acyl-CoA ligase (AMP-forming), exosortase A system-associated [Qipengyuania sediminis]|uniref:acyl-CoA ligase (AMP-forming), exosortase A system-associated n=1 Tax=Qipengyuania sediminis TaxID=1532023 RepID=UPI001059A21C|nr:acyl-CoA ligase (AMP-forming), exosortase A system-associated [Qipengyuania sediminis]
MRGAPDAPALVLKDRTLTYAETERGVAGLAGWLRARASEPGARVASWASKGWLTSLLPLAAPRAGLVHVPINPLLKHAQAAHILADSEASLLIATPARLATLGPGDVPLGCVTIEEGSEFAGPPLAPSSADPATLAAILYTSGSTGKPKGVMLSHANLWLGAVSVAHYLALAPDDVTLAVLPYAFDYGQNQLLSTWYAGGRVVPLDYLMPQDVVRAATRHQATTLAAVPPLWWQLVEAAWPESSVRSLRRITNSGGALTPELVRRLRARLGRAKLFAMYGLTEAFRSTYLDPALVDTHPASIGTAIPFAEVLVVRADGSIAEAEEEGELVHAGPLVAQGYWRDPQRSAERFRPAPAASRFGGIAVWSGDRVVRGTDGLLRFVGRRDAMIKSAGHRISPQEIEDAAIATGLVSQVAAFGAADERLGQAIVLVALGDGGADQALRAALTKALPGYMQPHRIEWRAHLSLSPNGKLDRAALAAELGA